MYLEEAKDKLLQSLRTHINDRAFKIVSVEIIETTKHEKGFLITAKIPFVKYTAGCAFRLSQSNIPETSIMRMTREVLSGLDHAWGFLHNIPEQGENK